MKRSSETYVDLDFIARNASSLMRVAETGHRKYGRGFILADMRLLPVRAVYVSEIQIPAADTAAHRMVRTYDPASQFIVTLLKTENVSTYHVAPQFVKPRSVRCPVQCRPRSNLESRNRSIPRSLHP
jgi:hypothetical protein